MNELNKNKFGGAYFASITFLVLVVLLTVSLNFFNNFKTKEITKLIASINTIEQNISEVEKNESLQIYSLLELNSHTISAYEKMNKVTKYINHLNVIAGKYNISFDGFNLTNGEIISAAKSISDDDGIAYQKTSDFIKDYRNDTKALFDLGFIGGIEGMDEMKFKVNFKIK